MYLKKHRCGIFSADRTHTSSEFDKQGGPRCAPRSRPRTRPVFENSRPGPEGRALGTRAERGESCSLCIRNRASRTQGHNALLHAGGKNAHN